MPVKEYKKIPKYYGLRIYLLSTILYSFLVFPIAIILIVQYLPDFMERSDIAVSDSTVTVPINNQHGVADTMVLSLPENDSSRLLFRDVPDIRVATPSDTLVLAGDNQPPENLDQDSTNQIGGTLSKLLNLLLISFLLGFVFNYPFKRYFRRKRKFKPISPRLNNFCRKYLIKTPLINSLIVSLAYGITLLYMVYILIFKTVGDEINQQLYIRYFIISIVASLLTILFVYFWQKHRVHIYYLDHIFSEDELKKRIFKIKSGRIKTRLLTSAIMTTLLPLVIVTFYLLISISSVQELGVAEFSQDQIDILLGKYSTYNIFDSFDNLVAKLNIGNTFLAEKFKELFRNEA